MSIAGVEEKNTGIWNHFKGDQMLMKGTTARSVQ